MKQWRDTAVWCSGMSHQEHLKFMAWIFSEVVLPQFPVGLLICRNHRTERLSVDIMLTLSLMALWPAVIM